MNAEYINNKIMFYVMWSQSEVVSFYSSGFPETQRNPFLLGDPPMISTGDFFLTFPYGQVHLQHCYSCHRELKPNKTIGEIRIVQLAFIEAK